MTTEDSNISKHCLFTGISRQVFLIFLSLHDLDSWIYSYSLLQIYKQGLPFSFLLFLYEPFKDIYTNPFIERTRNSLGNILLLQIVKYFSSCRQLTVCYLKIYWTFRTEHSAYLSDTFEFTYLFSFSLVKLGLLRIPKTRQCCGQFF